MVSVVLGYVLSVLLLLFSFGAIKFDITLYNLISLGGIFATFGSAFLGTSIIFEQRSENRVKENLKIFYLDILKDDKVWIRWSFLKRKRTIDLLNKKKFTTILTNPPIPFDVGSHEITVSLPTVTKDFFDLPIFRHYYQMLKYSKAFHTTVNRKSSKDERYSETFNDIGQAVMAFECTKDILKHSCIYRVVHFFRHFSIGLIIFAILMIVTIYKFDIHSLFEKLFG